MPAPLPSSGIFMERQAQSQGSGCLSNAQGRGHLDLRGVLALADLRQALRLDLGDHAPDRLLLVRSEAEALSLGRSSTLPRAPVLLHCFTAAAPHAVRALNGIKAPPLCCLPQGSQRQVLID